MKPNTILVLILLVTVRIAAQDAPKPQTQSHCEFADGKKITVTYSAEAGYRLSTDENLVTVKGISVPAGYYNLVIMWERDVDSSLIMRRQTAGGPPRALRIPLSVGTQTSPGGTPRITFDHTGGSCTLHLASGTNSRTVFSLEFAERNTDLPVLP